LNLWHEISDTRITSDGAQVVYVDTVAGNSQLCIASTDGKTRRQLTAGRSPRWSADGTRIAFLSGRTGTDSDLHPPDRLGRRSATHSY